MLTQPAMARLLSSETRRSRERLIRIPSQTLAKGAPGAAVAQRVGGGGGDADGGGGMFHHAGGGEVAQEVAHLFRREAVVAGLAAAGRVGGCHRVLDALGKQVVEVFREEGRRFWAGGGLGGGARVRVGGVAVRLRGAGGGGVFQADADACPVSAFLGLGGEAAVGGAGWGRGVFGRGVFVLVGDTGRQGPAIGGPSTTLRVVMLGCGCPPDIRSHAGGRAARAFPCKFRGGLIVGVRGRVGVQFRGALVGRRLG